MPDDIQLEQYFRVSASGGVNHQLPNHREVRKDEFDHLENATVRGGLISTRPGFRWLQEYYPFGVNQRALQYGKVQGSGFYGFASGALFVYAVDGHLFGLDPRDGKIIGLNPPEGQPFSRTAEFVFFEERGGALIAREAHSPAVIIEGTSSRFASAPEGEVPPGYMMADGWGYLAAVEPDRRRLLISDHEMSPLEGVTPFTFTQTSDYFLGARAFTVPRRIGRITGIAFIPWASTDTGLGPLAVFGESGVVTYDLSVPRDQWAVQDISAIVLNRTGSVAHKGIVEWGNDLWFSDQFGRIRSIRTASTDEATRRVRHTDKRVFRYYEDDHDDPSLRRWRNSVAFDNRILTTVWPQARWIQDDKEDRFSVAHRGILVWEGEVTETIDFTSERDIWAGVWTGIQPAALDVGLVADSESESGQEMCVALSTDSDGVNRFYELTKRGRNDVAPWKGKPRSKRISMTVVGARTEFAKPFHPKKISNGMMHICDRTGKVDVVGQVVVDRDPTPRKWFEHKEDSNDCLEFVSCGIEEAVPQSTLPLAFPDFRDNFYSMQPMFTFRGHVCIDSLAIEPQSDGKREHTNNVRPAYPKRKAPARGCPYPVVTYDALTEPPAQ